MSLEPCPRVQLTAIYQKVHTRGPEFESLHVTGLLEGSVIVFDYEVFFKDTNTEDIDTDKLTKAVNDEIKDSQMGEFGVDKDYTKIIGKILNHRI